MDARVTATAPCSVPPRPGETQPPAVSSLLLPPEAQCGIGGWIRLARGAVVPPLGLDGESLPGTTVWRAEDYVLCARGEASRTRSAGGWEVFAFGNSHLAPLVARILDAVALPDESGAPLSLPATAATELCWGLLPAAAVIAFHRPSSTICLLRDGFGLHPLYFMHQRNVLSFSSNLGALRARRTTTGINTDKISEMLAYGHRTGGRTLWQGLDVVAPGQLVWCRGGMSGFQWFWRPEYMFDPAERRRLERLPRDAVLGEVRAALEEALAPLQKLPHVVVPCGGGVDSSLLGAYLAARAQAVTFWCIDQPEAPLREAHWMEPLARQLSVPCEYAHVTRDVFLRDLLDSLWHAHQPAIGPNFMGGYALRRLARERGEKDFLMGELCDTLFGGLSTFTYLSPRFRLLRLLTRLPRRLRLWLPRGMADESGWLLGSMQVVHGTQAAAVGAGDLERAETLTRVQALHYPGQSMAQRLADQLTWLQLADVPSALHHGFYEADERFGGTSHYPFAHPRLLRLGLHLPHYLKRNRGHNKWLWRILASRYLGKEVAFRKKHAFPTLTRPWLQRAEALLPDGFLEHLLRAHIGTVYARIDENATARWTLLNLELWGRSHCWGETPGTLLEKIC